MDESFNAEIVKFKFFDENDVSFELIDKEWLNINI